MFGIEKTSPQGRCSQTPKNHRLLGLLVSEESMFEESVSMFSGNKILELIYLDPKEA